MPCFYTQGVVEKAIKVVYSRCIGEKSGKKWG